MSLMANAEARKDEYVTLVDVCRLSGLVSLEGRHWPVWRASHFMNRFRSVAPAAG